MKSKSIHQFVLLAIKLANAEPDERIQVETSDWVDAWQTWCNVTSTWKLPFTNDHTTLTSTSRNGAQLLFKQINPQPATITNETKGT